MGSMLVALHCIAFNCIAIHWNNENIALHDVLYCIELHCGLMGSMLVGRIILHVIEMYWITLYYVHCIVLHCGLHNVESDGHGQYVSWSQSAKRHQWLPSCAGLPSHSCSWWGLYDHISMKSPPPPPCPPPPPPTTTPPPPPPHPLFYLLLALVKMPGWSFEVWIDLIATSTCCVIKCTFARKEEEEEGGGL